MLMFGRLALGGASVPVISPSPNLHRLPLAWTMRWDGIPPLRPVTVTEETDVKLSPTLNPSPLPRRIPLSLT